jgi:hypothetical protein
VDQVKANGFNFSQRGDGVFPFGKR